MKTVGVILLFLLIVYFVSLQENRDEIFKSLYTPLSFGG